ncbi:MAG: NYN domain-containing protein [Deltaproteobacteria bacterium]|nr:NYN domain-containing protein [Deltaproteobacteria bacterium]
MQIVGGTVHTIHEQTKYLFIDGAYFRGVIEDISKKYFMNDKIEIDFKKVTAGFKKTFYYDCLDARKKRNETTVDYDKRVNQQKELFNSLRLMKGVHVYEGVIKSVKKSPQQKQVDVMIAVHMLTHSFRRSMQQAYLLTGDLDFKPVIDAMVTDGMHVVLWYEKTTTSKDLIYSADENMPITVRKLYEWSTDDFKKRYTRMPRALATSSDEVKDFAFIKQGKTEKGDIIELYSKENLYCMVLPDINVGYKLYVKHHELEFLESYVRDVHSDFKWD